MAQSFQPSDMQDLAGRVVLITGGSTGLGREAAMQLAKHRPSHIFITSRDKDKGHSAIAEIIAIVPSAKLTAIRMDLSSLTSVKEAANEVIATASRLDILMNNAGIMAVPPQLSPDGYEIQFATNYLGHALLTKLLLPLLLETTQLPASDVRIITLSSHSHQRAPKDGIEFDKLHSPKPTATPLTNYGQSKLANILHVHQLAQKYPSIKTIAVHPGMVNTGLSTTMKQSIFLARILMPIVAWYQGVPVERGVLNQLWACTSVDAQSGEYYEPIGVGGMGSALSKDSALAEKLWAWTNDELRDFYVGAKLYARPVLQWL